MTANEPRARTAVELRDDFLSDIGGIARYWGGDSIPNHYSVAERLDGLVHSILVLIDGQSGGFNTALDLVVRPHPDDKAHHQAGGESWIEDGTVLNESDILHELWSAHRSARRV